MIEEGHAFQDLGEAIGWGVEGVGGQIDQHHQCCMSRSLQKSQVAGTAEQSALRNYITGHYVTVIQGVLPCDSC